MYLHGATVATTSLCEHCYIDSQIVTMKFYKVLVTAAPRKLAISTLVIVKMHCKMLQFKIFFMIIKCIPVIKSPERISWHCWFCDLRKTVSLHAFSENNTQ